MEIKEFESLIVKRKELIEKHSNLKSFFEKIVNCKAVVTGLNIEYKEPKKLKKDDILDADGSLKKDTPNMIWIQPLYSCGEEPKKEKTEKSFKVDISYNALMTILSTQQNEIVEHIKQIESKLNGVKIKI